MKLLSLYGTGRLKEFTTKEYVLERAIPYARHTIYNPEMAGRPEVHIACFLTSTKMLWQLEHLTFPLLRLPATSTMLNKNIQYHIYDISNQFDRAYGIMFDVLTKSKIDIMVTIGDEASSIASSALLNVEIEVPHIFTAVVDPVAYELLNVFGNPTEISTGSVIVPPTFERPVQFVKSARKSFKHVLMPFDDTEYPQATYVGEQNFCNTLIRNNCFVDCEPLPYDVNKWKKLLHNLGSVDAVAVDYLANHVRENLGLFVERCNELGVTLFSSNATNVREGAATGLGSSGLEYSAILANQIEHRIHHNMSMSEIMPQTVHEQDHILVNPTTATQQGIALTPDLTESFNIQEIGRQYGSLLVS